MVVNEISWKLGGEAGFGIMTTGFIFSKVCARAGLSVFDFTEFPSLIRGGHNTYHVRAEQKKIHSQIRTVDILAALNKETIDLHENEINPGGALIFDSEIKLDRKLRADINAFPIPLLELAEKAGGEKIMVNNVILGASFALIDYDLKELLKVIDEVFGGKGKRISDINKASARAGYEYMKKFNSNFSHTIKKVNSDKKMLINGNEAVAMGAIKAGCKFLSAYPMTPASGILHYLAKYERDYDLIVKQTEDEIAAMNMAIGAGFAGVRSMTCTSGGGFALMVEALSLAGMSETPLVIAEVQRPGPSTGLPTHTGQEDLKFILSAAHGEFPRVVIAPGDVDECFYETINAFNLAEKYQVPVFILSDKHLGESRKTTEPFKTNGIKIERGEMLNEAQLKKMREFKRFRDTKSGVSPRSIPGQKYGIYTVTSDEHNEKGTLTETSSERIVQVNKRLRKAVGVEKEIPRPHVYGSMDSDVTVVIWGSTKGAALEALSWLLRDHVKVNVLHLVYLSPFPAQKVKNVLGSAKNLLLVEGNATAQLGQVIREKTGIEIDNKLLKYDGRPIHPEEIYDKVKEVLRHGKH
jgi:2-oxoglutarate ferredoxin oxidoreductase subunit alpha